MRFPAAPIATDIAKHNPVLNTTSAEYIPVEILRIVFHIVAAARAYRIQVSVKL